MPAGLAGKFKKLIPLGVLILALISGLLVVQPINQLVRQEMEKVRTDLLELLKKEYGLNLKYSGLNYGLLMGASFYDVELSWLDGSPFLSSKTFSLNYDLWKLISGHPEQFIKSLHIDEASLTMDLETHQDFLIKIGLLNPEAPIEESKIPDLNGFMKNLTLALPEGVDFSLKNLNIRILNKDLNVSALVDTGKMSYNSGDLNLLLSFAFNYELPQEIQDIAFLGKTAGKTGLSGNLLLRARYASEELQVSLETQNVETPWFSLHPQKLSLLMDDSSLILSKIEDAQPMDISINYDFENNQIHIQFDAMNWQLLNLLSPKISLSQVLSLGLHTQLDASLKFLWDLNTGGLNYSGLLKAQGIMPEIGPSSLTVKAEGDLERIHLDQASLDSARLDVKYSGDLSYKDLGLEGKL